MRTFLALALTLTCGAAAASAQVVGPLPNAPVPTNQTATLIFNAQLAVSRAASESAANAARAQNAQAAALAYQQAVQRYQVRDFAGARAAAIQALMSADRVVPEPIPLLSPLPPTAFYGARPTGRPFPLSGNVAQLDADAFVAQARGAVMACAAQHDPNTVSAESQLAAAQRADAGGNYSAARAAARIAVNLCAGAVTRSP